MIRNLVLLPGWVVDGGIYKKFCKLAPKDYQVFIPGYKILAPRGDLSDFKPRLIEYLKQNNLSKIILVGNSLGGGLALDFAHSYPEFVDKLYLVDPKAIYDKKHILKDMYQINHEFKVMGARFLLYYLFCWLKILCNPFLHVKVGLSARNFNYEKEASGIKVPTVIFWGEKDPVIPLWQGEKLHKLIPQSKLVVIKNVGHSWLIYYPEKFWEYFK